MTQFEQFCLTECNDEGTAIRSVRTQGEESIDVLVSEVTVQDDRTDRIASRV